MFWNYICILTNYRQIISKYFYKILGAYDWAKKTLKDHAKDKREYLYSKEQLENAKSHDLLWNAAQVRH